MPRVTRSTVVFRGKYLMGFELRVTAALWKSLWNCWQGEKCLEVKICQLARTGVFLAPKALSSNQLGNSLDINIGGIGGNPASSRF